MHKKIFSLILVLALCMGVAGCSENDEKKDLWSDAVYTKDTSLGEGEKTIEVKVIAQEKSVTFTISTDSETLGKALLELGLISGEKGPYGLYVKSANGIVADYDTDKSYWAFNKDGAYMSTGVDKTKIKNGERYEIVYTK